MQTDTKKYTHVVELKTVKQESGFMHTCTSLELPSFGVYLCVIVKL